MIEIEALENEYEDAIDGDIYVNPCFGDLWIVQNKKFIKINHGYTMDLEDPSGFLKVGHVENVITKWIP